MPHERRLWGTTARKEGTALSLNVTEPGASHATNMAHLQEKMRAAMGMLSVPPAATVARAGLAALDKAYASVAPLIAYPAFEQQVLELARTSPLSLADAAEHVARSTQLRYTPPMPTHVHEGPTGHYEYTAPPSPFASPIPRPCPHFGGECEAHAEYAGGYPACAADCSSALLVARERVREVHERAERDKPCPYFLSGACDFDHESEGGYAACHAECARMADASGKNAPAKPCPLSGVCIGTAEYPGGYDACKRDCEAVALAEHEAAMHDAATEPIDAWRTRPTHGVEASVYPVNPVNVPTAGFDCATDPPTMVYFGGTFAAPAPRPRFYDHLDRMRAIHDSKNADYADSTVDPFRNFRQSELVGIPAHVGAFIRLGDKYMRIANLLKREQTSGDGATVKDESVEDTLIDLANYALIVLTLHEQYRAALGEGD